MEILPPDLRAVLDADPEAREKWDDLTPLARRDFTSWIDAAAKPDTRKRRVDSVPSRLASGKRRPCCFAVVPLDFSSALNGDAAAKARWKDLTPDQKRDFTDWVNAAEGKAQRAMRLARSISAIAAQGKGPPADGG